MAYLEDLRMEYVAIQEHLDVVRRDLEAWLLNATRNLGIMEPRIESRVKKPHSFISKVIRKKREGDPWQDPLADASDKVGARADVVFLADAKRLGEHILSCTDVFADIKVEDKSEDELGDDRLGYQGVHFDVVPRAIPNGLAEEHARCEIQVRTNAQAAWAMATHDVTYKSPVELPSIERRRMNRLTALVELFDEEVSRVVETMMGDTGYPSAIVIGALESVWMRYVAEHYDRALTREIVEVVLGEIGPAEAHDLVGRLEEFAEQRTDKLAAAYENALIGTPLLAQPESVLIFYMLDTAAASLQRRWTDAGLPHKLLDDLATEWGERLPAPH